jgi:hypothetical protein
VFASWFLASLLLFSSTRLDDTATTTWAGFLFYAVVRVEEVELVVVVVFVVVVVQADEWKVKKVCDRVIVTRLQGTKTQIT